MRRKTRGSITVETAAAAVTAAFLLAGTLFVAQSALALRRAHGLARHAAALTAAGVPRSTVESEIESYASRFGEAAVLSVGRYLGSPAAGFYQLQQAIVTIGRPRPALLGGGTQTLSERAVLEAEAP